MMLASPSSIQVKTIELDKAGTVMESSDFIALQAGNQFS
jgi:hypothetical protein